MTDALSNNCKRVCRSLHNITAVNKLISEAQDAESMVPMDAAEANIACLFNNIDREDAVDEGVVGAILNFKRRFNTVLSDLCEGDVYRDGKIDGVISNYSAMFDLLEALDSAEAAGTASGAALMAFMAKVRDCLDCYNKHKSKATAAAWDALHKGVVFFLNNYVAIEQDPHDKDGIIKAMATALKNHSLAECLAYHEATAKGHVEKSASELKAVIENMNKCALGLRDGTSWKEGLSDDDTLAVVLKAAEKLTSGPGQTVKSIPDKVKKAAIASQQ